MGKIQCITQKKTTFTSTCWSYLTHWLKTDRIYQSKTKRKFNLPFTHNFSISVSIVTDFSPTQKHDNTRSPTNIIFPGFRCIKFPRRNNRFCNWFLTHKAPLFPSALPWNKSLKTLNSIGISSTNITFKRGLNVNIYKMCCKHLNMIMEYFNLFINK